MAYPEKYVKESKKSILERAKERHAKRAFKDRKRIQDAWNRKLYNDLEADALRLGARGAVYQNSTVWDMLRALRDEIRFGEYKTFKADYKEFSAYIRGIIESETKVARIAMTDKLFASNMAELVSILGIKQENFMTFFEADELRGNPHFFVDAIYRSNCQTAVIVHELRRRGFDIQALGNTDGSWLEKLSKGTNKIWRDADGNIPEKTYIGARYKNERWEKTVSNRKQLITKLESNITEDGRYHIDWIWKGSGRKRTGHIITVEKIGDTLRYYDPQTGVVIKDLYSYIEKIDLSRGIRMLRVDNLQLDTNWVNKIVAKAGAQAETGSVIGKGGTTGFNIKEDVAEYVKNRNKASSYKDKVALDKDMVKNPRFVRSDKHSTKNGSIFATEELPNKITAENKELSKNITMAKKMANNGYDVYLLSNPHGVTSADFILSKNGKVYYVEGKLSTGKNSLDHNLNKGGKQSERILIDLTTIEDTNYITEQLINGFQENYSLREVMLLKGGRLILISAKDVLNKNFKGKFKRIWEQRK